MPRVGRIVLPNYPHHVVQRGHNRQVVFAVAEDYQRYLSDLRELKDGSFSLVSVESSEKKTGGLLMVDRLDGHVWSFEEYVKKRGQMYF